ncbi:MAG: hypothetical protein KBD78_09305 [Oligoflexales bacterium]|nr:hypothetical protein [Oligoflexales bacterium]
MRNCIISINILAIFVTLINCSSSNTHLEEDGAQLADSVQSAIAIESGCTSNCGFGYKSLSSTSRSVEGYQLENEPLPSWSAVKLVMVAAYIQSFVQGKTESVAKTQWRTHEGDSLNINGCALTRTIRQAILDDTLVASLNDIPSCLLEKMKSRPVTGTNVLDYVRKFTSTNGRVIPGFNVCGWSPGNGAPSHTTTTPDCSVENKMAPKAAVQVLSTIWTDRARFTPMKELLLEYLTARNVAVNVGGLFSQHPYLAYLYHKTGSVPNSSNKFSFSDMGYLIKGQCIYAYSYFDANYSDWDIGIQRRFKFWETLKNKLCPN